MDNKTIIKSLRMENFGCFKDHKVVFEPGFNQVIGPNESGKSTLIRALFTVLFEEGTTKKKNVAALNNWTTDRSFRLTLDFSVGGKDFNLIRDYNAGRDIMIDSDGIMYEGKAIGEKLALYFSVSDRNLFESTFCFTSDDPSAPESSKERLKSAVETPVFFGFNRSRADRYLDEEIKKLENPRAHGPRELDMISDQISGRLQEKSELEKKFEELEKSRRELDEAREKVIEHESAMERLDKEIEGGTAYQEINNRMVNLEERLQLHLGNYSRAAQMSEDLVRVEKELKRVRIPDEDKMAEITLDGEKLNATVDDAKQAMDETIARRRKANRGFIAATMVLAVLCLVFVLLQNGYIQSGPVAKIVPYTIPVMFLVWLSRMGVYIHQFSRKKKATATFREAVGQLDTFYAGLNEEYELKAANPIKALEEAIQKHRTLINSSENLRNTISALSENKGLKYLDQVRQQLEGEVAQINLALAPLTGFALASGKLPALKEELISRRVRANALRERAALLTERCSAMDVLRKSMSEVDNQVEVLKRKHKEITERLEVLKITRNAINRAADQLIEDTFEAYGASASSFLYSLTGARYDQIRFNRENSRFEIKITACNRWIEINESLSSSTRDCIYLAFRLAGVALLSAEFCPPIILDQAETRMDRQRRKAFMELMQSSLRRRQILYVGLEKLESSIPSHIIEFASAEAMVETAAG